MSYDDFKSDMIETLENNKWNPANGITTYAWLHKFFERYPKWNTGYWGNKFRNAQQSLKRNGAIGLNGNKWYRRYD